MVVLVQIERNVWPSMRISVCRSIGFTLPEILAMAINLLHRRRLIEHESIWIIPDNVAIFSMALQLCNGCIFYPSMVEGIKIADLGQKRTWIFREWVEVESIYDQAGSINYVCKEDNKDYMRSSHFESIAYLGCMTHYECESLALIYKYVQSPKASRRSH